MKYGPNEIAADKSRGIVELIIDVLKEPMVLLMLGINFIYFLIGDIQEVYSLLTFLILIVVITIYQENKTEKTLHALKELSSPRAVVIREGKQLRIPGRDLVPDDIVILNEGDRIPADILLIRGGPLSVDESILTGESFAVEKFPDKEEVKTVYSGTLVLKGQALGIVQKTGSQTELGQIGTSLKNENGGKRTNLQDAAKKLVYKLSLIVVTLTILVILFYWFTRNNLLDGILVGLTLAMAILPNELPAVLLIFMAAGAWRISKKNVLTRKIPSIEALGGITFLCVDKTGTLTQNKMILKSAWNEEELLNIQDSENELPESFHALIEYSILASPVDPFDPMEKALLNKGSELLKKTEHLHPEWQLSREYQITNELLAVSYAWKEEGESYSIGAKGACEAIIDLCHFNEEQSKRIISQMERMASEGLRVIAVAKSRSQSLPDQMHDLDFSFMGLLGFEDPIREDAKDAVQKCQEAGIKILMMTGDHPATAKNIARQIGLHNSDEAVTGQQLQELDNRALEGLLHKVQIFCRMKPQDKLRIITVLQSSGEVVAMTGDGVNDAPALKKAQIGIAMGKRGTDVAREASSVVLLDDSFSSIVDSIKTGRRIFINLKSAFSYLLAIHIPITILSVVPVFMNLPLILLPVHIAFLHLIIEPASTTLFEALPESTDIMKQSPDRKTELFTSKEFKRSLLLGSIVSLAVIGIYGTALQRGLAPSDARGITFTTLIILNIVLILLMTTNRKAAIKMKHLKVIISSSFILLAIVLYVPFFRALFRFNFLHLHDLLPCLLMSFITGIILYKTDAYIRKQ